ncbi:MAG TPA: carbohydrate ABC transporter permease [Micromonosporaceae bacterium]|nr:carbohydrate ABC transporter permease [Micromonosporaceae bacterium]
MTSIEVRRPAPRRRTFARDSVAGVRHNRAGSVVANAVGVLFTMVMAFPAYWMINTAFKPPNEILTFTPHFVPENPTFANFVSALRAPLFLDVLVNSLIITTSAVSAALVVGFLGALAVARFRFYGRRALILVVLLVQMVPFIALLIPLFLMLNSVQLTNTLPGVILVYAVLILPYTVWTLRGFIANVPRELDEAALVDGCSRWQTFTRVILPLVGPGLVATSIYGFIQAWNEFIIINTLNSQENQNLMAWLLNNQTQRQTFWGPLMAGAIITSLPVVIFFLMIQKNIAAGLTAGAVKG